MCNFSYVFWNKIFISENNPVNIFEETVNEIIGLFYDVSQLINDLARIFGKFSKPDTGDSSRSNKFDKKDGNGGHFRRNFKRSMGDDKNSTEMKDNNQQSEMDDKMPQGESI